MVLLLRPGVPGAPPPPAARRRPPPAARRAARPLPRRRPPSSPRQNEADLILHQKNKHFKCGECGRRLSTAKALLVHALQVHKHAVTAIPDAKPGREDPECDIFGSAGIPPGMRRGEDPPRRAPGGGAGPSGAPPGGGWGAPPPGAWGGAPWGAPPPGAWGAPPAWGPPGPHAYGGHAPPQYGGPPYGGPLLQRPAGYGPPPGAAPLVPPAAAAPAAAPPPGALELVWTDEAHSIEERRAALPRYARFAPRGAAEEKADAG